MASVETTTIRVRLSTKKRLARQAELAGTSMTEVLEAATDLLEEQRLLAGAVRSWEKHSEAMQKELEIWDATLADGLPDDDRSGLLPDED